ncbi:hypothetical protein JCM5296_003146 [Sporobolomyces johnsonii]
MPITHTQSCVFAWGDRVTRELGKPITRYTPVSINCSTLPGKFSLCVNEKNSAYSLSWTAVRQPLDIKGGRISLSWNGAAVAAVDIWAGNFPPSPSGELEIPRSGTFSLWVNLTISLETGTSQDEVPVAVQMLAARSAAFVVQSSPNNVCLDFPRTSRQLWANEGNLCKLSAYYDSLLSSDFAEGSASNQAVPDSSSLPEYTFDDSDAETDELDVCKVKSQKVEKQAPRQEQEQEQDKKKENDGVSFKKITIVDTAYTTYYAVLVWITTGYIRFAPLRSKFRLADSGTQQARAAEIDHILTQSDAQLPPPASPKSVYRLAHLLELPELVQLALDNFKSQINTANVAYELYSDVSCYYDPIRDVALTFAVANWKEVREAEGTREMERRAYAEELPKAAAGVSMMLSRKLTAK